MTSKSALVLGSWIFAGCVAMKHEYFVIAVVWVVAFLISCICDKLELEDRGI